MLQVHLKLDISESWDIHLEQIFIVLCIIYVCVYIYVFYVVYYVTYILCYILYIV